MVESWVFVEQEWHKLTEQMKSVQLAAEAIAVRTLAHEISLRKQPPMQWYLDQLGDA
jgi:hypothetical protein